MLGVQMQEMQEIMVSVEMPGVLEILAVPGPEEMEELQHQVLVVPVVPVVMLAALGIGMRLITQLMVLLSSPLTIAGPLVAMQVVPVEVVAKALVTFRFPAPLDDLV
jgi:hypothetical protein